MPLATPKHSSSVCSHRSDVMYPASVEAAPLNFLVTAITREQFHGMLLTLTVLVTTVDAQWEGMGDVGSARYEPALLPPCPTIRVLSYSN